MDKQLLIRALSLLKKPLIQVTVGSLITLNTLRYISSWYTERKVNNHAHDSSWDWSREVVIVTGGSSGIGATIVSKLAAKHIKVLILDRNPPLKNLQDNMHFYKVDLADSKAITMVAARIKTDHGDPTILINNAGLGNAVPLLELPEENLRKVFDINIIAPIILVQHFLPSMLQHNHGHIVNIASQASFATQATNVDYACTKSALLSFHEGLTQEIRHVYKAPLVRTSIVHPTWVKTAMIADLVTAGKLKDAVTPEHVAGKVVDQLLSGSGAQIIVPAGLGWTSLIRGLPGWLQETLRDRVSGILLDAMRGTGK